MRDEAWIVVATDEDNARLASDAEKLRRCYPDKYDIRITASDLDLHFVLSVRHRE